MRAQAQQQLLKIREEKAERERILKKAKQDQADRKKEEREKKLANELTAKEAAKAAKLAQLQQPPNEIRIQVRLFDGTSIRATFTPDKTIQSDVRPWIDEQRPDGNAPYTLKQILTPQPSRSISLSEEGESLGNLRVGRTANLVMVPVRTYTEAYASAAPGLAVRGASAGYNLVRGTVGTVLGTVGSMLGFGQVIQDDNSSSAEGSRVGGADAERRSAGSGGINIRTLSEQRNEAGDHQFYNGNQTNFEPRRNEDDKDR